MTSIPDINENPQNRSSPWLMRSLSALLVAAVTLPFWIPFHRYPIPSFYQEWVAGTLAVLASLLVAIACRKQSFAFPVAAWIPLALLPSVLINLVIGPHVVLHPYLLYLTSISLALLLILIGNKLTTLRLPASFADLLAGGLLFGGIVTAGIELYLRTQSEPAHAWISNIGVLGQRNHNGLYLWLGVIGASQLFLRQTHSRLALLVGAGFIVEAAVASESRSVYLYAAGGLAFSIWSVYRTPNKQSRRQFWIIGLTPIFLLIATNAMRWGINLNLGGLSRISAASIAGDGRIGLLTSAWRIMAEHPLLGAGPGTFIRESWLMSATLPTDMPNTLPATHAHNLFFQLGAEIGSPTAIAAYVLLACWLISALRKNQLAQRWIFIAVPLAVLIHNQIEYSLWYVFFLVPTALCMGAATAGHSTRQFHGRSLVLCAAVGVVLSLSTGADYLKLNNVLQPTANKQSNAQALIAETTHPLFGAYASSELASHLLPASDELIQFQFKHLRRALYVAPLPMIVPHRYAAVLEKLGRRREAERERFIAERQLPGSWPVFATGKTTSRNY